MTIFINGKQKRVRRPPTIDGISVHEFILRNADPIWLHQNEMWALMDEVGQSESGNEDPAFGANGVRSCSNAFCSATADAWRMLDCKTLGPIGPLGSLERRVDGNAYCHPHSLSISVRVLG